MDIREYKKIEQKILKGWQYDKRKAKEALQNKNNTPEEKILLEKILKKVAKIEKTIKNKKYPHIVEGEKLQKIWNDYWDKARKDLKDKTKNKT